jgi:thiol-disulfide isomerase/thioredoxin
MMRVLRFAAGGVCLTLLAASGACDHAGPGTSGAQWYHAQIETSTGEEIPFFLQVPEACDGRTAIIVNGEERIQVACEKRGRQVEIKFPVYGTRILATSLNAGTLEGTWIRDYLPVERQRMAFRAVPVDTPEPSRRFQFESGAGSPKDVSGVWRMQFDLHGPAKGTFAQSAGVVSGTAEMPSEYGDLRFLAGSVNHERFSVSSFDGQHAYLLEGHVQPDGGIAGTFICCDDVRDTFVAQRSEDFQVVDPLQQVKVISDDRHFDFDELHKPKYDGKAVIVELFGTWCPNCNDLAPVLGELYQTHHRDGLEVVGLAFELSQDPAYNEARLAAYRQRHRLTWDVVIAQAEPDVLFARGAARLSSINGVPVTIFLNRDRTVHAIYAGFSGPATGAEHRQAIDRFRTLTQEIVSSR